MFVCVCFGLLSTHPSLHPPRFSWPLPLTDREVRLTPLDPLFFLVSLGLALLWLLLPRARVATWPLTDLLGMALVISVLRVSFIEMRWLLAVLVVTSLYSLVWELILPLVRSDNTALSHPRFQNSHEPLLPSMAFPLLLSDVSHASFLRRERFLIALQL